ncbi:hypothetical protein HDU78_000142 [Chytriomyces hyalinus]|nr:hypothetical protein HDU78_000142 [Chytriomyces hyalinus]KAJ3265985.1 hypothetical protein HDU77_003075 [Chytriomyces hyalinus]
MSDLTIQNPAFKSFAIATGVLGLKMVATNLSVVTLRVISNNFGYAEDRVLFPTVLNAITGGNYSKWTKKEEKPNKPPSELIPRLNAASNNDAGSIPIFLLLSLTWIIVAKPSEETATKVLGAFVGARFVHVFAFVTRIQPFRVASYLTGLGATGYVVAGILKAVL